MKQAVAFVLASSFGPGWAHILPEQPHDHAPPTGGYELWDRGRPMQYWDMEIASSPCDNPRRIEQLEAIQCHLESAVQRLSAELQRLHAHCSPSDLQRQAIWESVPPHACRCENEVVPATPVSTSLVPPAAQPAIDPEVGLFPGDAGLPDLPSTDTQSDDDTSDSKEEGAASSSSGPFYTGDAFVLVVALVVAPAAVFIGLMIFCRRR